MKRFLICAAISGGLIGFSNVAFADGAKTFGAKCASCHGKDGKSDTPMGKKNNAKDLTASKMADDEVTKVINDGKGKSPAFKGKIADGDIKELVDYLKSIRK